ncbi:MAG TPA: TMEM165/GDT1 family protein [Verrucomicrobiae bacterium]|nr:TMEM165/GDT1 family protein [Verrucomicrobiae bacterium]
MTATILIVFGVIFIAELPDKSMLASLTLSARFRKGYVWAGAAVAFVVQVVIAVTAGHLISLLPHKTLEIIVGTLFLLSAALLALNEHRDRRKRKIRNTHVTSGFLKVFTTSFIVVFLGEWGDVTQIATANYTVRYHDPVGVGIGAVLALWAAAGLSVMLGAKWLRHIPARTFTYLIAIVLLILAVLSFMTAFH